MDCFAVQKVISVHSDDKEHNTDDIKTPLLNPVIVSLLALPLLQIISLPKNITEHGVREQTARDCQSSARQLLSIVCQFAAAHHPRRCHGDIQTGALQVFPSAASHTCYAYVQLARYLSLDLHNDADDGVDGSGRVSDWLEHICSSLSTNVQPSVLLTHLVASLFLIHNDVASLEKCLQLLHAICQSDKTQVHLSHSLSSFFLLFCTWLLLLLCGPPP